MLHLIIYTLIIVSAKRYFFVTSTSPPTCSHIIRSHHTKAHPIQSILRRSSVTRGTVAMMIELVHRANFSASELRTLLVLPAAGGVTCLHGKLCCRFVLLCSKRKNLGGVFELWIHD